jgi:hypothetical protein
MQGWAVVLVSLLLIAQDTPGAKVTAEFEDVTKAAGLETGNGQGRHIAWGDFDNDGYEDLLLNGSILFRNNHNGTFANVTAKAKMTGGVRAGIWGDYNKIGRAHV